MAQRLRFWTFLALLLLCFLGGGGARDDVLSLLYLRPAVVLCAALILLLPGKVEWRAVRVPLALCLVFAVVMVVQLIPLPPQVWLSLPERQLFAEPMNLVGLPQPWRPLSIAPDLTLNSLASLVVPVAVLTGFAALDRNQRFLLLPILIAAALVSVLLGIAQLVGGEMSPFYLYRITNRDSAVGLFANRNHQAALLVISFPMLAIWAATGVRAGRAADMNTIVTAAIAVFLVPMVLVTGSRAGLLFGGVAAAGAWLLYIQRAGVLKRRLHGWRVPALGIGAIAVAGLAFSLAAFDRAESLRRLLQGGGVNDLRFETMGSVARLAAAMQPFGSGFGTFDPLYRVHERTELLTPFYLNHAHNDLLELAITGGIPALALLLAGIAWILFRATRLFRSWYAGSTQVAFARMGMFVMLLLLAWSLVDYPLRTPSLVMIFAIAAGWLGMGGERESGSSGGAPREAA
jgi:O-antigen ligase